MIIYPAIDLIAGEVVRLHKGDFEQKTTYGTDPISVARAYAEAGAAWLHLVDLDGAKDPANHRTGLIADIIAGSGLKVQTGGGIRSRADVEALLAAGASRVVIGSLAVRDREAVGAMIRDSGAESICLAADVVHGRIGNASQAAVRLTGSHFNIKPALVLGLVGPDRAHFGQGVALDQGIADNGQSMTIR